MMRVYVKPLLLFLLVVWMMLGLALPPLAYHWLYGVICVGLGASMMAVRSEL